MLAGSWPDWAGETAVIVATGPSANAEPIDVVKGRARVIVIKSSWRLAPWADVLYGCDKAWWIANQGAPTFGGLRISASPTACRVYRMRLVKLVARAEILTGEVGRIGCGVRTGGGHSGFHALNLAVQFGAKRVVLVGFDMTLDHGLRWHSPEDGVARRKDHKQMADSRTAFDDCAARITSLGIDVINASPLSALKNYRKVSLVEAIAD